MKLHQYNEMMAFLTRPKFQNGGPVVPPEKPSSDILFKRKINNLLTGFYGTTGSKGFLVDEIQSALDEAEKKGVLSKEDGLNFVRERKKYYDNYFADRAQKQRLRGVVEGIGTVDRSELVDGGLIKQGPNTGKYLLRYREDGKNLKKIFDTKKEFEEFAEMRRNLPKGGLRGDPTKRMSVPTKKELEIAELFYGPKYNKKGIELWQSITGKERSGIKSGKTTATSVTKGRGPKPQKPNQLGKDEFIKLAKANKGKTYKEFLEVLKDYKTVRGSDFTIQGISDRIKMYNLGPGFFRREEPKGMSKESEEKRYRKRKSMLETTAPFTGRGTGNFQFHHIMNIGGEIPLDTNDIAVISAKMNRTLSPYNRDLNNIANDISNLINDQPKNYLKRIDELNDQAEGIVKKAIKELPKEYKNLIGFNRVVPVFDEYGTPVNFVGKKFGGSNQKNPAIKLENLSTEQANALKKQIKTDALSFEKAGVKDKILSGAGKVLKGVGKVIKPIGYAVGTKALFDARALAKEQGIELSKMDQLMAIDSGDPNVAINNYMRRNNPEFAAAERAKDLAQMTDDFEEVGKTTFGKYNDQIKNIKLP